ncbi:MAG: sigma 54-interacting transcriptional regulator [Acidobacteria bacterium]|nr:sigma 54-interacting transcriptional regulator [Acidobacteriota bacterium]
MAESSEDRLAGDWEERLRFESLVTELSASFINLPSEQIDAKIVDALRRICEELRIDACGMWSVSTEDPQNLSLAHYYRLMDGPAPPEPMRAREFYPWCLRELSTGRTIVVSSMDGLPPEAAVDRESWRHFDIKSALVLPLAAGGLPPIGVLSFNAIREEHPWPEPAVKRLLLLTEIIANALHRKRSDQALRESEARLNLAAASADAGLWSLDLRTGRFWVTDKARELFRFAPEQDITLEGFLDVVHTGDRDRVRQAVDDATRDRVEIRLEYRIVLPDGDTRWIASRGTIRVDGTGVPDRLTGVSMDVTERKRNEQALLEQKARLEAAVEVGGIGFYEMRNPPMFVYMDERIQDLFGLPAGNEHQVRDFFLEHVHPEDRVRVLEMSREMLTGKLDRARLVYRYRHPDRGELWFSHSAQITGRDGDGNALGTLGAIRDITEEKRAELSLKQAFEQIRELKDRLQQENVYLREEITHGYEQGSIIGHSAAIRKTLQLVDQVAPTLSTVLIQGETGTGKELVAHLIHQLSPRADRLMITVNCSALPETLVESELFGREKGAYTGALTRQAGRFELADGSTLFLDEIGELTPVVQVRLLRVLQEGFLERLGSSKTLAVNVRVIAATNRDLAEEVRKGTFRQDLYYRLNVFPIQVPPLRDRPEDIPLLVRSFVEEFSRRIGRSIRQVPRRVMEALQRYPWPGNVRELRNVIERAVIVSTGQTLLVDLPVTATDTSAAPVSLAEAEAELIRATLKRTGGRIKGPGGAAAQLGMKPSTLYTRMNKLGIPTRRDNREP